MSLHEENTNPVKSSLLYESLITIGPDGRLVAELERDGLVKSQRTAGRFVTDDKEKIMEVAKTLAYDEIARMVENISSLGYRKEEIPQLIEKYLDEH